MLTIMVLGIASHWEGICGLKPAKAHCSPQSSFCLLFDFYTLCWAEPRTHFTLTPSFLLPGLTDAGELYFHW